MYSSSPLTAYCARHHGDTLVLSNPDGQSRANELSLRIAQGSRILGKCFLLALPVCVWVSKFASSYTTTGTSCTCNLIVAGVSGKAQQLAREIQWMQHVMQGNAWS